MYVICMRRVYSLYVNEHSVTIYVIVGYNKSEYMPYEKRCKKQQPESNMEIEYKTTTTSYTAQLFATSYSNLNK